MESEEFLMMRRGSMGSLFFFVRKVIQLSERQRQRFIDDHTREISNTFHPPPGLTPDQYSELFLNHYIKSRQSSHRELERATSLEIRQGVMVQVGNLECLREVEFILSHPSFIRWENPFLAQQFIFHGKKESSDNW